MPFEPIYPTYSRTNSWNLRNKNENWRSWKMTFFFKSQPNLLTDSSEKVPTWGRGVSKNADVFYGWSQLVVFRLFVRIESSNYLWNLRITSVIILIIGVVITRQLTNCKPDDKLSSSASAKEAFSVSVLHPFISCAKFMPTVIIFLAPPSHMFIYFSTRYG